MRIIPPRTSPLTSKTLLVVAAFSIVAFFLSSQTASAQSTTILTDDFTNADGTPLATHNPSWTVVQGAPQIQNNTLVGSPVRIHINVPVATGDQCVSYDFESPLRGRKELFLKASDTPEPFAQPGYYFLLDWNGGATNLHIADAQDWVAPEYSLNYLTPGMHTFKACVTGTTLSAFIDATLVQTATARVSYTDGYPRLLMDNVDNNYIDNFIYEGVSIAPPNEAPVVGNVSVSPNPTEVNTTITATTTITDQNPEDSHTATADWGDGNSTAACSVNQATDTVTCIHPNGGYASPNVYSITISVSDSALSGTSPVTYASVYNPTQGSIFSAGHRFSNPNTAYPSTTGNVTFGLNYKYQGSLPVGLRQFSLDFNAANIHFNATMVSSLVVSGSQATLRGTGTLNGTGNYDFLVVGNNGNGVRIKITDPGNSNAVVYDSQNGANDTATPITSVTGNVIVH